MWLTPHILINYIYFLGSDFLNTILTWSVTLLAMLYSGLTIAVSILQIRKKTIPIAYATGMMIAGLLLLISTLSIASIFEMIVLLIISLLLLHFFAIINGLFIYRKLNFSHHLVRLVISITIIISFYNLYH